MIVNNQDEFVKALGDMEKSGRWVGHCRRLVQGALLSNSHATWYVVLFINSEQRRGHYNTIRGKCCATAIVRTVKW